MEDRFAVGLSLGKKIMLAAAAFLAAAVPAVVALNSAAPAQAQGVRAPQSAPSQKSPRYVFEVASVKPAPERDYGTGGRPTGMAPVIEADPAQITFMDVSLVGVICRAYGLLPRDIKAPEWMQSQKYDIHAKVPAGAPKGHVLEMLQNLLADRFQMKLHRETREEPGYILTVGQGGHELKQSAPETQRSSGFGANGHMVFRHHTMSDLANGLTHDMSRPVVDRTNLAGEYDLVIDASPESMPGYWQHSAESDFPTIFAALRHLGLNLTPEPNVARKYLVVDSALKVPTAN